MKLNLQIIYHFLDSGRKIIKGEHTLDFSLSALRFYRPGRPADGDYLYLVEESLLEQALASFPHAFFFCVVQKFPNKIPEYKGNFILLEGEGLKEEPYALLSGIFETFQQWEEDLNLALLEKHPLQEILDIGTRFMPNPVGLFDKTGGADSLFRTV